MTNQTTSSSPGPGQPRGVVLTSALTALLTASCLQPAREMGGLECASQGGCSEGYVCHQGMCVRPAEVTDAGVISDAAVATDMSGLDTPGQDAARPDTSTVQMDAAVADTVLPDTVLPDVATQEDVSSLEAGVSDAGTLDAVEDAGVEDAGSSAVCGNSVVEQGETCDPGPLGTLPDFWGCVDCHKDPLATCIGTPQFCARTADVILVPADHSTIQLAMYAAPAGGIIFVDAAHVDPGDIWVTTGSFTIAGAPGASIRSTDNIDLVTAAGDAVLTLVGMRVSSDPYDDDPDLINADAAGTINLYFCDLGPADGFCVDADDSDNPVSVRVLWSRIHDCQQGGILVDTPATYDLRHNFIYRNGESGNHGSWFGGVYLDHAVGTFAFNTVVGNWADSEEAGVDCAESGFALRDSIIVGNENEDVDNDCEAHNRRNIISSGLWSGALRVDPLFVAAPGDLHIDPSSLAADRGQLIDPMDYWDIDGQLRPLGDTPDVGADEVR